ncbi:hypothetical protein pdam_00025619 [Pocillopora damicornis]|uniref:Uncharacterized protein n=1 Tax=Pocillopora damicornis TaxID=46731 RepID=A0A3M6U000_POCDA|nr:hypothetical protein pdam_00025619 [Pocillopora damicornis]
MNCSKPISNHKASLGFSGAENEVDLILSRAAVFAQPANINFMTICPLYRERLGWLEAGIYCEKEKDEGEELEEEEEDEISHIRRAKIAPALKGPFLKAPIIKNGINCRARIFAKLVLRNLFGSHF